MNGKQAKVLHRMQAPEWEIEFWKKLPSDVKGKIRKFQEEYPKAVYANLRVCLHGIGYGLKEYEAAKYDAVKRYQHIFSAGA